MIHPVVHAQDAERTRRAEISRPYTGTASVTATFEYDTRYIWRFLALALLIPCIVLARAHIGNGRADDPEPVARE